MRKITIFLLGLLLIGGLGAAGYYFFLNDSETPVTKAATKPKQIQDIPMKFDVPLDHIWEVSFDHPLKSDTINEKTVYVTDDKEQKVSITTGLSEDGKTIKVQPPNGQYGKGQYYELHMESSLSYTDGSQVSKPYVLGFVTKRDEVEKAVENPNLKKVEETAVKSVKKNQVTLKVTDGTKTYQKGDIILVPVKDQPEPVLAFKITAAKKKDETFVYTTEQPKFMELFQSVDIYNSYDLLSDQSTIVPGPGVNVETIKTAADPQTSVASSESATTKQNGEFQIGKIGDNPAKQKEIKIDVLNGLKLEAKNLPIKIAGEKILINANVKINKPEILTDIEADATSLTRLNTRITLDDESTVSTIVDMDVKKVLRKLKKSKKKEGEWLAEKTIPLAEVTTPTPMAGIFFTSGLNLKLGIDADGKVSAEFFIKKKSHQEYGIVKKQGEYKEHVVIEKDIDAGITGKGEVSAKAGGQLSARLSAYGVAGIGMDAETGPYGKGEVAAGSNTNKFITGCYSVETGWLTAGNFFIDLFKKFTLVEIPLLEERNKLYEYSTCEELKELDVFPKDLSVKTGNKIDIEKIAAVYINKTSTSKTSKNLLTGENYKDLEITVADKDVASADIVQTNKKEVKDPDSKRAAYKLLVEIPKEPADNKTTITVAYKEKRTGKEVSIDIPVFIEDVKILSKDEIRKVMEKLHELDKKLGETLEETSSLRGADDAFEANANIVFQALKPKITNLASTKLTSILPSHLTSLFKAYGEGNIFPEVYFDAKMEILENKPSLIRVKTFQLEDEAYLDTGSVVITAIKENGTWVIDDTKWTDETLTFKPEEILPYLKGRSGSKAIEYAGKANIDGKDHFIYYYKDEKRFASYTVNGGHYYYSVPAQYIPAKYKISEAEAVKLVREAQGLTNSPDVYVEAEGTNELGDYVIHVYSMVIDDPATGEGHAATSGWYGVNPLTREIYDEFKRMGGF